MRNKSCLNCVWNNECYIQSAVRTYMRHRHPLVKLDFSEFNCSHYENIDVIKTESEKIDSDPDNLRSTK